MSINELDLLKSENESLKNQLTKVNDDFKIISSQLEAHIQQLNESISNSLNLRTSAILLQKNNKELLDQIELLKKQINDLNVSLKNANTQISVLEKSTGESNN